MTAQILLLTGVSGVGKSTVLHEVATRLSNRRLRGFISREIRSRGARVGFRVDTLDGDSAVLAHVSIDSDYRLGKYGVDVVAFDSTVTSALEPDPQIDIFLIDEIGPMECYSDRFIRCMTNLLDSGHTVVATIHRRAGGYVQEVKNRDDVELWEVTLANREEIADSVLKWIQNRRGEPLE